MYGPRSSVQRRVTSWQRGPDGDSGVEAAKTEESDAQRWHERNGASDGKVSELNTSKLTLIRFITGVKPYEHPNGLIGFFRSTPLTQ